MRTATLAMILALCLAPVLVFAQSEVDRELTRAALEANRKVLVNSNMELAEEQQEAFGPLYDAYQKELGKGLRIAWQMLTREFRNLSVLFLFILLHVAGIFDRRGYRRAADRMRTWVSLPAVERGMSKMLRTRLRFVMTELGGAALDIDNEADLVVAEKMMGRWREMQARQLGAA